MILWMQILNRKKLKEAKSFMVLALVSFWTKGSVSLSVSEASSLKPVDLR